MFTSHKCLAHWFADTGAGANRRGRRLRAGSAHGAQVFANECGVCHSVSKGMAGMMGPNLSGVVGRKSGSLEGFSYSQAMRSKDVTWQAETISQLITQPQAYVPGTYMPYMGLASADDRQAVVCYLKEQR